MLAKRKRTSELMPFAEELMSQGDQLLDNVDIKRDANDLIWSIDYESYHQTCFSLVTETDFTDGQVVRITEKTVKSLAMGRPTIVFGNPMSLELAREFGFQTFDPIVNEGYDRTSDLSTRFAEICNEVDSANKRISDSPYKFLGLFDEITKFNSEHARGGGFRRAYRENVES